MTCKTVTVTAFRRPAYTRRTLESLSRCHGIQDYKVSILVDHGCDETLGVAKEFMSLGWRVAVPDGRLGCNAAVRAAMAIGFAENDYHINLEDDTPPAKDCLRWFEWARQFGGESRVFSVLAYCRQKGPPEAAVAEKWFCAWGWATWADRWQEMQKHWPDAHGVSWDVAMNHQARGDRYLIRPELSRTQNIGRDMGTHNTPEVWEAEQYNQHWAGEDANTSEWRLEWR